MKLSESLKTYNFIFMDVVSFSTYSNIQQYYMISLLSKIVESWIKDENIKGGSYKISPTGDGMVIGFEGEKELPYLLAIHIQQALAIGKLWNDECLQV